MDDHIIWIDRLVKHKSVTPRWETEWEVRHSPPGCENSIPLYTGYAENGTPILTLKYCCHPLNPPDASELAKEEGDTKITIKNKLSGEEIEFNKKCLLAWNPSFKYQVNRELKARKRIVKECKAIQDWTVSILPINDGVEGLG